MGSVQEATKRQTEEVPALASMMPGDFSLVLGGPVFQLLRRAHLEGDAAELLARRLVVITAVAWFPLLILSIFAGPGVPLRPSFLGDFEVHARFLVALPVLILAEKIVHERITKVARRIVERRIVLPKDMPGLNAAIVSAMRMRNSVVFELALLAFVYAFNLWLWGNRVAIASTTWYAFAGGRWNLTIPGYWYVYVSLPIVQFILLRWYWRLFIWYRLLWQISKLDLNLIATHPDHCAGLAFLGRSAYAFSPILFAQGAMLAGVLSDRILYGGEKLMSFKLQIAGCIAFFVIAILGPLVMFTPKLAAAKRKGLAEYGQLAQDYVELFDRKWVRKESGTPDSEMLGSGDIQSLADLGNSYGLVREMRPIPFGLPDLTRMALATAVPFAPLLLTVYSPDELLMRIVQALF